VVTPLALIEERGTDAVRYWASTSKLGQDTAFSKDLLKIGKKLVNKLWNATKFAAIHLKGEQASEATEALDKWILTRLHRTVQKATTGFEAYEYAAAMRAIEDFFWNDFCDNYLELAKKRSYDEANEDPAGKASASHTLGLCLDAILRLFAPVMPHITEELWSHIFVTQHEESGSIHARGNWPKAADYLSDEMAEQDGIATVEAQQAVRKAKTEAGVSIKRTDETLVISATLSESAQRDLRAAGNIRVLHINGAQSAPEIQLAAESDAA